MRYLVKHVKNGKLGNTVAGSDSEMDAEHLANNIRFRHPEAEYAVVDTGTPTTPDSPSGATA